jgi:predicted nuclease of predicted toxin-antitoxin system
MKILLDANVPISLVEYLSSFSFKVFHISRSNLKSASDQTIFKYAQKNKYLIITFDKDFLGDEFLTQKHYGIIYIKSREKDLYKLSRKIVVVLQKYKSFKNRMIIIED